MKPGGSEAGLRLSRQVVIPLKIHKKSRNFCCGLCCRSACITRNFFKTQNPRLINKSGFILRAAYDGACTVHISLDNVDMGYSHYLPNYTVNKKKDD